MKIEIDELIDIFRMEMGKNIPEHANEEAMIHALFIGLHGLIGVLVKLGFNEQECHEKCTRVANEIMRDLGIDKS